MVTLHMLVNIVHLDTSDSGMKASRLPNRAFAIGSPAATSTTPAGQSSVSLSVNAWPRRSQCGQSHSPLVGKGPKLEFSVSIDGCKCGSKPCESPWDTESGMDLGSADLKRQRNIWEYKSSSWPLFSRRSSIRRPKPYFAHHFLNQQAPCRYPQRKRTTSGSKRSKRSAWNSISTRKRAKRPRGSWSARSTSA